ncbi:MAG TPA: zf-HC2 domain-containing protein [Acidimicrobiales bacterium]|nr:zf-HC2 domain-containing protein [Acidimicrobiales bacterium]
MTWHADAATVEGYQAGELSAAQTASVEAHLPACGACRTLLAAAADRDRLARNWSAVAARLDERSVTPVERALRRLGMGEGHARLVTMTPAARSNWLLALVALVALAGGMSVLNPGRDAGTFYAFLVLAPLLPVAGVAAAFGSVGDPARELAASTPKPAFELLLVRTLAAVAATMVFTAAIAFPVFGGWDAAAWLLPALGLTAASLALSTWVPAHRAATVLGAAWVVAAAASGQVNRLDPDVLRRFVALEPAGQVAFAALAAAGTAVFLLRRRTLDLGRCT